VAHERVLFRIPEVLALAKVLRVVGEVMIVEVPFPWSRPGSQRILVGSFVLPWDEVDFAVEKVAAVGVAAAVEDFGSSLMEEMNVDID